MTIIRKFMKAGELSPEWSKEFANPDAMVVVELRAPLDHTDARPASRTVEQAFDQISELQDDDFVT